MKDFQKALYSRKGSQLELSFDLTTMEGSERVVVGFATLDNVDFGDDIVAADASLKAFQNFRGNVRVQHDKGRPVGRVLDFTPAKLHDPITGQTHDGIKVAVYISKGAEDIWEMCQDGTLSGFSIGGAVMKASKVYKDDLKKTVQVINDYALLELSLVDSPMNGLANVVDIFKSLDGSVDTMEKGFDTQNIFYCGVDILSVHAPGSEMNCPACGDPMVSFGVVNENEDIAKSMDRVRAELKNETKGGQSTMSDTTVEIEKDVEGGSEEVAEVNEAVIDEEAPVTEVEEVETEVEEVVETPDAETAEDTEETKEDSEEVAEVTDEEEDKVDEDAKTLLEELKAALEEAQSVNAKGFEGFKEELETLSKGITDLESKIETMSTEQADIKEKLNSVNNDIEETQKRLDVVDEYSDFKKSLNSSSQHQSAKEEKKSIFKGVFYSSEYGV